MPHEHAWPEGTEAGIREAFDIQHRLRGEVRVEQPPTVHTAAGLDVAYRAETDDLVAAVAVLNVDTLDVVDSALVTGKPKFPYMSGLFAFRELPPLLRALEQLSTTPDVLVCDGHGLTHPRRFGVASHLGVLTDLPSIGVAKTPIAAYGAPGPKRGDRAPLWMDAEHVGYALRTQDQVKPVFVSVGHRFELEAACDLVLRLSPRYRLPETTRTADHLGRTSEL